LFTIEKSLRCPDRSISVIRDLLTNPVWKPGFYLLYSLHLLQGAVVVVILWLLNL